MHILSQKIIHEHLVRKTGAQKSAFREMLISELNQLGVPAHAEGKPGLLSSVNVVAGNADTAEIIFGAHYDTCPRMPLPNFITPRNPAVFILYQMMLVVLLIFVSMAVAVPTGYLVSESAGAAVWFLIYFGLLALMMKGPANPTTMNDNTSGVVALIELMTSMPEEIRARCAFVFFDNEELGMLGSSAFRKKHGKRLQTVPLINMDCVGDGDTLLMASSKAFRADEKLYAALRQSFEERGPVLDVKLETTVYPSDQSGFKKSMAIAALKKSRAVGYYMDRIHTTRDTVLREDNIDRLASGLTRMAQDYLTGPQK